MNVALLDKLKGKPWLKWVGYPLFFNAAFLVSMNLTFPGDALRERIVGEARNAGYLLEIGDVDLAGLTGVRLEQVALMKDDAPDDVPTPIAEGAEAPPQEHPGRITFDAVTAKADLFALLAGKRAFAFAVDAWGGELEGRVELGEERRAFEARARGIELAESPLKAFAGLDMAGRLTSFDARLEAEGADFSKAEGRITILGEELTLNGGEVQHFELPKIVLGKLEGEIPVEKGQMKFDDVSIEGADLQAKLEGTLRLNSVLKASALNGRLKIKPSDDWWNRNEMLKTAANFALPEGKDGWRTISLYGQLQRPGFRPVK